VRQALSDDPSVARALCVVMEEERPSRQALGSSRSPGEGPVLPENRTAKPCELRGEGVASHLSQQVSFLGI
jgi:hypothetical protein